MNLKKRVALRKLLTKILAYKEVSRMDFLKQICYNNTYYDFIIEKDKLSVHRLLEIIVLAGTTIHLSIADKDSEIIRELSGTNIDKMAAEMGRIALKLIKKQHKTILHFKKEHELIDNTFVIKDQLGIKSKSSLDHIINYLELLEYKIKTRVELCTKKPE